MQKSGEVYYSEAGERRRVDISSEDFPQPTVNVAEVQAQTQSLRDLPESQREQRLAQENRSIQSVEETGREQYRVSIETVPSEGDETGTPEQLAWGGGTQLGIIELIIEFLPFVRCVLGRLPEDNISTWDIIWAGLACYLTRNFSALVTATPTQAATPTEATPPKTTSPEPTPETTTTADPGTGTPTESETLTDEITTEVATPIAEQTTSPIPGTDEETTTVGSWLSLVGGLGGVASYLWSRNGED